MTGRGRPLRFLALVLFGWIVLRGAMLWPRGSLVEASVAAHAQPRPSISVRPATAAERVRADRVPLLPPLAARRPPLIEEPQPIARTVARTSAPALSPGYSTGTALEGRRESSAAALAPALMPPVQPPPFTPRDRWQASAWLAARPGEGIAAGQPQLGGSQAGLRLAWIADPVHRIALVGRLAAPLRGQGREATVALEWQPTRLPVRLVVERRFALDRSTGGPGVGVVGGVDAMPLAAGFRLEAYGQAGLLRRARGEPYADGALRVTAPPVRAGGTSVRLGIGAWGGAQRDAQRLDVGPTLIVPVPLAGRNYRLALDWRQRIAGSARPGSGPAVTLGADF